MQVVFVAAMIWPDVFLLLLRRYALRWWLAFLGMLCLAPVTNFVVVGGLAYLDTAIALAIRGDSNVTADLGMTNDEYLMHTFEVCGIYGVMFAGLGFLWSLPVLIGWRVFYRASFQRLTRSQPIVSGEK